MIDQSAAVTLRRGCTLPLLGFGTWQMEGDEAKGAVLATLELGYRHVDTATVYGNEAEVGRAIAESGLARESLLVTTKVPGNASDARATLDHSLLALGLDAVDLWLLHWPPVQSYEPTKNTSRQMYEEMLDARDTGLAKAIGVSNFNLAELDELTTATGEPPEVNQIPWSPSLHFGSFVAELRERGIALEGYSPLRTSRLDDSTLVSIAASCDATPAQVVVRWHLQRGIAVIPKSRHRERIAENAAVFGFFLDDEAMGRLDRLVGR